MTAQEFIRKKYLNGYDNLDSKNIQLGGQELEDALNGFAKLKCKEAMHATWWGKETAESLRFANITGDGFNYDVWLPKDLL